MNLNIKLNQSEYCFFVGLFESDTSNHVGLQCASELKETLWMKSETVLDTLAFMVACWRRTIEMAHEPME